MGQEWTNHRVSVYLDTFNIHRPPETARLSERERERILNSLVQVIRGEREIIQDSVEERVMASGRIEEEYFAPDSIID